MKHIIRLGCLYASVFMIIQFSIGTEMVHAQWDKLYSGTNMNSSPQEIFIDGDTMIVARAGGGLIFSEDGGQTWSEETVKPLDSDADIGGFFKFKGHYYARRISYNPDSFIRSGETLNDWQVVEGTPLRADGTARGMAQVTTNGEIIFAHSWGYSDENGNEVADYLKTTDGVNWLRVGQANGYGDYTFIGDSLYAVAGVDLMVTADTGRTWSSIGTISDTLSIRDMYEGNDQIYALVLPKNKRSWEKSSKRIMKWDQQESKWITLKETIETYNVSMHADGDRVGITVHDDLPYYSPDGGETWLTYDSGENYRLSDVKIHGEYFYATGTTGGFGSSLIRTPLSNFTASSDAGEGDGTGDGTDDGDGDGTDDGDGSGDGDGTGTGDGDGDGTGTGEGDGDGTGEGEETDTSTDPNVQIPVQFELNQNYPNPFNPNTNIQFSLNTSGYTQLKIYNSIGIEVMQIVNGYRNAGEYSVSVDLSNFTSGIYFYQLKVNGNTRTRKMTLIK